MVPSVIDSVTKRLGPDHTGIHIPTMCYYSEYRSAENFITMVFNEVILHVRKGGDNCDALQRKISDKIDCAVLLLPSEWSAIWAAAEETVSGKKSLKVLDLSDISEEVAAMYQTGYEKGMSVGIWPMFSDYLKFAKGEQTIIHGVPGSGKTEFVEQLTLLLAREHGIKWLFYTPETFPPAIHFNRMLERDTGKPFFEGRRERVSPAEICNFMGFYHDHFLQIQSKDENRSLENILACAKKMIYEHGVGGLVIDPWNEIEHERRRDTNETEYIGQALMKSRMFARHHGLILFIVAHPMKLSRNKDGKRSVPTPYDIAGSAHWFNKADNIIAVHRDKSVDGPVRIMIQKVKYKMRGHLGELDFFYDKISGVYSEKGIHEEDKNDGWYND